MENAGRLVCLDQKYQVAEALCVAWALWAPDRQTVRVARHFPGFAELLALGQTAKKKRHRHLQDMERSDREEASLWLPWLEDHGALPGAVLQGRGVARAEVASGAGGRDTLAEIVRFCCRIGPVLSQQFEVRNRDFGPHRVGRGECAKKSPHFDIWVGQPSTVAAPRLHLAAR